MNSTIKQKTGKCIDCPEGTVCKYLVAKRCPFHYQKYRAQVNSEKKAGKEKSDRLERLKIDLESIRPEVERLGVEGLSKLFKKLLPEDEPFKGVDTIRPGVEVLKFDMEKPLPRFDNEMPQHFDGKVAKDTKLWMEYHIQQADRKGWVCDNCGKPISSYGEEARYGAQAHVLPKNQFPSVKNVLENHLLLGRFDCFDHGTFDASWERASRMRVFPVAHAIVQKLIPRLPPEELRRVPEVFLKALNQSE